MSRLNYYYLDYLYREIGLTRSDIESVPESRSGDDACSVTDEQLFNAVKSLCDNPELPSRKIAIMYIVWMVALSIKEEEFTNQKTE